jgi:general transcription factor 3C polypeptide 3 (transcription factor C subunit 4)
VTQLLAKSNLDYISGNSQQAIDGFLEVIRLDPYIYGAWSSLGTLYEEEGNADAARQMKFCGLHIEGDAEGWRDLAMSYK